MSRLNETEQLTVIVTHIAHWGEANALPDGPVELALNTSPPSTFTLAKLQAQRVLYVGQTDAITTLEETTLPALRSERDTLFGTNAEDVNGVWFWLLQYKPNVTSWLGARHALAKTVPNLGRVFPGDYEAILKRFHAHWTRVNAAGAAPFTLEAFTLATLKQRWDDMIAKNLEITTAEGDLLLARQEREDLFGDQPEEQREAGSIIAHLLLYHGRIAVKFPGQPIARTLPRIFPEEQATLPKFKFNWRDLGGGQVKTWVADPAVNAATTLFLKEGAAEQTKPFTPGAKDTLTAQTWSNLTVVGELDVLELRNGDGRTVARGTRDAGLGEPN